MKKTLKIIIILIILMSYLYPQEHLNIENLKNLSLQDLMSIKIVTAGKKPEDISDIPASAVVITRDEIEKYGYKDLSEIIDNIVGFYKVDDYFWLGSTNFGIRGFFSTGTFNDVHIMVNGVNQVADSYNYYPDMKINIPIKAIDKIEVIRGPMSIMYGSNAFMGAINIITNANVDNKSIFSVSTGSNDFQKGELRIEKKSKNSEMVFNAGHFSSSGPNYTFSDLTTISSETFFNNYSIDKDHSIKDLLQQSNKYLGISYRINNLFIDVSTTIAEKEIFDGLPSVGKGTQLHMNSSNFSMKYEDSSNEKFQYTLKLGFFLHNYYFDYSIFNEDSYATNNTNSQSYEIEYNMFYNPSNKLSITMGFFRRAMVHFYKTYDYPIYADQYSNTEITISNNIYSNAIFTELKYNLTNKLKFIAGTRLEKANSYTINIFSAMQTGMQNEISGKYHGDDINIIPRTALIYKINNHNNIKLIYGKSIKVPSMGQNAAQLHSQENDLIPARIQTLEVNYSYFLKSNINFHLNLFRNHLDNLIVKRNIFDPDENSWTLNSNNRGEMLTYGIESRIFLQFAKKWHLNLCGSYQCSTNKEDNFKNIKTGYSPSYMFCLKTNYDFTDDIIVSLTSKYISEMESFWDTSPIDIENENSDAIGRAGQKIDAKYVINTNFILKNLFHKGYFFEFQIKNLLDNKYYFPTTPTNRWADRGTLDFNRRFIVTIGKNI